MPDPADSTPVSTTEFVAFAKRADRFHDLGTELIGLSLDQVFSHIKWIDRIKEKLEVEIPFPIIADTGAVATRLGTIHPGLGANTVRAVFIVDDTGKLRLMLYYPQEVSGSRAQPRPGAARARGIAGGDEGEGDGAGRVARQ
jgi:peroxiredoxin (alkyl hydroperoxide reductase subunit C)